MKTFKNLLIHDVTYIIGRGDIFIIDLKENKLVEDDWFDEMPITVDDILTYDNPSKSYKVSGIECRGNLMNSKKYFLVGLIVRELNN